MMLASSVPVSAIVPIFIPVIAPIVLFPFAAILAVFIKPAVIAAAVEPAVIPSSVIAIERPSGAGSNKSQQGSKKAGKSR